MSLSFGYFFFFFNDTATTEIYTLSLHDALPICARSYEVVCPSVVVETAGHPAPYGDMTRSEEHTSELQSRLHLVCRLLLEKKKKNANSVPPTHVTPPSGRLPTLQLISTYDKPLS